MTPDLECWREAPENSTNIQIAKKIPNKFLFMFFWQINLAAFLCLLAFLKKSSVKIINCWYISTFEIISNFFMYNWNFLNVSENLKNYQQNCWCKKSIDKSSISAKSCLSPTTSAWWIPLAYLSNDFPGDHCSAAWFSWPLISGSMSYRWVAACKVDISVNTAKLGEHITPKPYSNRDYLCTSKRCQNSCNTSFCSDVQIKASSLNSHCLANFTAQSWVQEDICNRFILSKCLIILFLPKFTSVF